MDRSLDIYAVDISPKMLERGRARLLRLGFRAKPVIASADLLPFRDREMDLAMAALVLEHMPRPSDAVREMARVTSPGGTVLFVTTRPHAPDLLYRLKFRYQPLRHEELLQWMANARIGNICSVPLPGLAWPLARMYVGTRLE
jgi:ubiquinone/menaquinone biosynthesis C-methylase UbiE